VQKRGANWEDRRRKAQQNPQKRKGRIRKWQKPNAMEIQAQPELPERAASRTKQDMNGERAQNVKLKPAYICAAYANQLRN